jgi:hypothetical protein
MSAELLAAVERFRAEAASRRMYLLVVSHGHSRLTGQIPLAAAQRRMSSVRLLLDEHAAAVLDRLIADEWKRHVVPAFAVVPPERWRLLIQDCIYAERAMREHKPVVEAMLRRTAVAEEAMAALKTLIDLLRRCGVATTISDRSRDDPLPGALDTVRIEIEDARLDAERTLRQHSRKTDVAAARSAGVGCLKASIRGLSGKPYLARVMDLAMAVLNLDAEELTEDAVRKALTPREHLRRGYQ